MAMSIEETLRIALEAHKGQKDLDGKPVILHIMAVGAAGKNEIEQKVGILHDIIEDTEITRDDLRKSGVDEEVLDAVDLLTHRDKDTYEEYIRHLVESGNLTAMMVKLHDLDHNQERASRTLMGMEKSRINDQERRAMILDIVKMHTWASNYIVGALRRAQ
ncbi:MAG: hypothetical protein J6Y32_06960 [Bacteroidales bacterium]|nr:hypothetical protein [Bacteroidales bacterium]